MFVTRVDEMVLDLGLVLDHLEGLSLQWGFFANDVTPSFNTSFADLVEGAWDGYSRQAYADRTAITAVGGVATASYLPVIFSPVGDSDGAVVYGAFLINTSSGEIIGAERFSSAPITIPQFVNPVYTPQQTLQNLP